MLHSQHNISHLSIKIILNFNLFITKPIISRWIECFWSILLLLLFLRVSFVLFSYIYEIWWEGLLPFFAQHRLTFERYLKRHRAFASSKQYHLNFKLFPSNLSHSLCSSLHFYLRLWITRKLEFNPKRQNLLQRY